MIRRGKTEGWLSLPDRSVESWAIFNGIARNGVGPRRLPRKGMALVAERDMSVDCNPLVSVPSDMILSRETVDVISKSDRHLREILTAFGENNRPARYAILLYLLVQATHCCPEIDETIGVSSALTEYLKFLPMENLPTFWNDDELELLIGTSLAPAIEAKMKSLYREYEHLRSATKEIEWCERFWWDEVEGLLSFDDWKQADAFYRSRALEFPGIGDAMVPYIDMANHASGDQTAALYDSDGSGNGLLLVRDADMLQEGQEITITYGDEKGACEMIFSYGFLEEDMILTLLHLNCYLNK